MAAHQHNMRWSEGGFSKKTLYPFLFIYSTDPKLALVISSQAAFVPFAGEAQFAMNWDLPMHDLGQELTFERTICNYNVAMAIFASSHQKRYRPKQEEMADIRNRICW